MAKRVFIMAMAVTISIGVMSFASSRIAKVWGDDPIAAGSIVILAAIITSGILSYAASIAFKEKE